MYIYIYIHIYTYVDIYIYLYLYLSLSLSIYVYIYIYHYLSISLSLSIYIYIGPRRPRGPPRLPAAARAGDRDRAGRRRVNYYSTPREESFTILLSERNPLLFY